MELESLARAALAAWESGEYLATEAALENLNAFLLPQVCYRADHEDAIQAARSNCAGDDDISFDTLPLIAVGEDLGYSGAWVSAWVWVPTDGGKLI